MLKNKERHAEIPHELRGKLTAFDSALNNVENEFEPLFNISQVELNEKLTTLDKAKLDLVAAYSINSLFWMYLNVCGVNPKDHGIKQELDRIRSYMNRVKEIQDKEKAPKLDVGASKRIVKNALWQAAQKEQKPIQSEPTENCEDTDPCDKYIIKRGRKGNATGVLTEGKIRKAHKARYMDIDDDIPVKKKK